MEHMDKGDTDDPLEGDDDDAVVPAFTPEGFERWRRDSAVGSVGTGIARGLQYVFQPPQDEPVMVAPVPGDPPDPDRIQVILDPDDPTKSIVVIPPAAAGGDDDPA